MIVSLGELAETAKKATLGCGHSFGIAEEMAFATRWLCERGLRGAEKLIHCLQQFKPVELEITHSADTLIIGGAGDAPLAALSIAPSVGELLIAHRDKRTKIEVRALAQPLLLMPFLARAADAGETVSARGSLPDDARVAFEFNASGVQVFAHDAFSLIQARADNVVCCWGPVQTDVPTLYSVEQLRERCKASIACGYKMNDKIWDKLLAYAHNSYVPISEASRLTGAGAGTTDND